MTRIVLPNYSLSLSGESHEISLDPLTTIFIPNTDTVVLTFHDPHIVSPIILSETRNYPNTGIHIELVSLKRIYYYYYYYFG